MWRWFKWIGTLLVAIAALPAIGQAQQANVYWLCTTGIQPFCATSTTNPLPVTATVSSITGATSNASSAVVTSSTNLPTVSYLYGFNGTTWDQLRVGAGNATFALRVTTASNDPIVSALGSPFQAGGSIGNTSFASIQSGTWTVQPGNTPNTTPWLVTPNDGTNSQIFGPCQTVAKTYTPISITTATTTRIVAPASAKRTYICYLLITTAASNNVAIVEGTGGTCGSGTAGVVGGTTAANGLNFAANGGVSMGVGGFSVAATAGTNVDLCLITSASTPLAGTIAWVQQ